METLYTDRLILKPLSQEDIPAYQQRFNDYRVIRYLASIVPWPYPEDGVAQFFNEIVHPNQGKGHWFWGIHLKDKPEVGVIGAVELFRQGKPHHRGFWLAHDFWGNGYMTEACHVVTDYAFDELGFETLIFNNAVGNKRSARVKEKAGAVFLREEPLVNGFVDPELHAHELWELTKENWKKRQAA